MMKKYIVLFLTIAIIFTFVACSEVEVDKKTEQNDFTDNVGDDSENESEQTVVFSIGEEAKTSELSITIDKTESPDPDILINDAKDGYEFLQIHYTFKNISNETIQTPKSKAFYIVYEEGDTGDSSDMTSEDGSDVLPGGEKENMYRGYVELAPDESTSGWMMYQRPAEQKDVTIHYYSGYINKAPDLVFKFTVE